MVARRKKYVKNVQVSGTYEMLEGWDSEVLKDGKYASVGHNIMDECLHTCSQII